jgi:hypothetical protein
MVLFAAPAFLGHWALITPTLISHFQHDDNPSLIDVMAHADIDIYPF